MNHPTSHSTHRLRNAALVGGLGLAMLFGAGCANDAQTGGLIGAGLGALAGQAIGHNSIGTVIGTAVGAGAGYVIGNESDKAKSQNYRYLPEERYRDDDRYRDDNYRYRDEYRYRYDDRCRHNYHHREYYEWHYRYYDPCDR